MGTPVGKDLLNKISAIATLVTPFLQLSLGGLGWLNKSNIQALQTRVESKNARIHELKDKLREGRI